MKRILPILFAALFISSIGSAQEIVLSPTVISSAGDYAESGDISLSWTLGEVAVATLEGTGLVLTQGFQQAFLSDPGTGFQVDPLNWDILAYPNPVVDQLQIQFDVLEPQDFIIEIQDVTGKLLSQEKYDEVFPGDIIPVEMSSYKYGSYFFRILTDDRKQMRVISIRKI